MHSGRCTGAARRPPPFPGFNQLKHHCKDTSLTHVRPPLTRPPPMSRSWCLISGCTCCPGTLTSGCLSPRHLLQVSPPNPEASLLPRKVLCSSGPRFSRQPPGLPFPSRSLRSAPCVSEGRRPLPVGRVCPGAPRPPALTQPRPAALQHARPALGTNHAEPTVNSKQPH